MPQRRRILPDRYKTQLCETHKTGASCRYGTACVFAHDEHELRTRQVNTDDSMTTAAALRLRRAGRVAAPPRSTDGSSDGKLLSASDSDAPHSTSAEQFDASVEADDVRLTVNPCDSGPTVGPQGTATRRTSRRRTNNPYAASPIPPASPASAASATPPSFAPVAANHELPSCSA